MVTPVLSQPVARPALVGVYELTHLNMSPDRAHTARSQGPGPIHCSGPDPVLG